MKVGVFGGTFDPPHMGHLVVAQEVWHRLGLDRVLWIPAATPPHKTDRAITPGPVRLDMVRAAIAHDRRFHASDLELRRGGVSYTVDTLRELRDLPELRSGAAPPSLYLILGADQLAELHTWKDPDEVTRLATLVGFARAGSQPAAAGDARIVTIPRIDISATLVRERVAAGAPITYLVPAAVERVITREALYR